MKTLNSLLLVTLAMGVGVAPILAQHGHGAGAGHIETPDHTSQMGAGHTPAGMHDSASQLTHNPALASKLQALLPAGTNLQTAASGFKNLGQFVAAVHVAHNLNISFDQLKAKMTGTNAESLGHRNFLRRPASKTRNRAYFVSDASQYPGRVRTFRFARFTSTSISWNPPSAVLFGL